jgi:hypothetical protein
MTVAFQAPPHVNDIDRTGLQADLEVMKPFFIDNGFADLYGIDTAHIHYSQNFAEEAVLRVDFPEARIRVSSVVPRTAVDLRQAVGWWFGPDGAVPWFFAAEEMYAHPWEEDLAKIGGFFVANGLTKYGVRSLKRPWELRDEAEVEHTDVSARIQVYNVVPRSRLDDPAWKGTRSVWRFTNEGPLSVTDCEGYCNPDGSAYK